MQTSDDGQEREPEGRRRARLMLGILGGTSLLFPDLPPLRERQVHTPFGPADVQEGEFCLLLRHQHGLPPHRINYRANLSALALCGVDRIIAFGSVGSLQTDIPPGSLVIPTDFVSAGAGIPSVHDHAIVHVCSGISRELAERLHRLLPEATWGGIYVQTPGPRIETIAEVKALARFGTVVGMTVASEATLATELGIPFAALCMVDNYAHGLSEVVPTYEHILEAARAHRERTRDILRRIVEGLG